MKYMIPKEIQSETKLTRRLSIKDVGFVVVWMMIAWMNFSIFVHSHFAIPYWIYSIWMMIRLMPKVSASGGVRRWESYFFYFIRPRSIYHGYIKEELENNA